MAAFTQIVEQASDILWNYLLLFLLVGTGIFFTIKLHFVQLSSFADGVRHLFKGFSLHGKAADKDGMSSFQALATAIAAQVGTGNITGCATALVSGGPGALFWTWVSAFFGMATIYAEAVLAQTYRTTVDGQVTGGPVYYIRAAFKGKFGKFLAIFFSVALILALGFMGNMVQSNSIGDAFHNAFGVNRVVVGVVIAVLAAFIFLGGVKRIAAVTEKLVPIMALFYIIGCVIILVMNASAIPNAFVQIFTLAFQPQAIAGGVAGVTVQQAMRYGVARGLFSNEAGLGSTPHAHALAKVKQPQDQGALAIIGVFVDTFVILTLTALVLITSGLIPEGMTGTALTQAAFSLTFGSFGKVFIAICMLFFAFSTILGWYFFGQVNFNALFGSKYTKVYSLIVVLFILIGSSLKVDLVWALADFFNGLMAVPNLLALLALSGWKPELPLVDPFCGSGTIAIEAAAMATNTAPGLMRRFAFERLQGFDMALWQEMKEDARAAQNRSAKVFIRASDISTIVVEKAEENCRRAGFGALLDDGRIVFHQGDARSIKAPEGAEGGLVIANPPYGEQSNPKSASIAAMMADFAAALKSQFPGWTAWLLTSDRLLPRQMRLKESRKIVLFNGPLECRFFRFDMVAGSNRRKTGESLSQAQNG